MKFKLLLCIVTGFASSIFSLTVTAAILHVDQKTGASGDRFEYKPFKTIQAAADQAKPGDTILIHAGTYREFVSPLRGGTSPDKMITYRGVPGEEVIVSGAEPWNVKFTQYKLAGLDLPVWSGKLPEKLFTADFPFKNFNPFKLAATDIYNLGYNKNKSKSVKFRKCRPVSNSTKLPRTWGMVIYRGQPLRQCWRREDMQLSGGKYFVSPDGKAIIFRLPGDAAPQPEDMQLAVREQVFAPGISGLRFIKLENLIFEYAAHDMPYPVNGMVSASSGRYWIFENCTFRHANTIGLDIGMGHWKERFDKPWRKSVSPITASLPFDFVIRSCNFTANGTNGIFAYMGISHHRDINDKKLPFGSVLIEGCTFTGNNWQGMYRMKEAAIKLLAATDSVIRGNNISSNNCMGIWLDVCYGNLRVTQNLISGNMNNGIFCEAVPGPCLIDNNIVMNTVPDEIVCCQGVGIYQHQSSNLIVTQNLIANNVNSGIKMLLHSKTKTGTFHKANCQVSFNQILNNIICGNGLFAAGLPVKSELSRDNIFKGNVCWGSEAQPFFELNKAPLKKTEFLELLSAIYVGGTQEKPPFYEQWQKGFGYRTAGATLTGPLVTLPVFEEYFSGRQKNYAKPIQLCSLAWNYWLKINLNPKGWRKAKPTGKKYVLLDDIDVPLSRYVKYDYFGNPRIPGKNHPGPFCETGKLHRGKEGWIDVLLWPNPKVLKTPVEKVRLQAKLPPTNLKLPSPPWSGQ